MTADEISDMLNGELYEAINSAEVFTFGPPSIPGLGPGSGFTIMIQDKGGNTPQYLAQYTDKFIEEARKRPEIASISTLYQADIPQKAIRINNEKVLKAGVSLQDLHEKISAYLGGSYVNNFNRFGRMYQTYIQAASEYRLTQSDLDLFYITNNRGESLPIASFITVKDTTGPQYTNRFNLYSTITASVNPAEGYSSGEVQKVIEEVASQTLPSGYGYEYGGMAREEASSSGAQTAFIYAICIFLIYLILACLYESFLVPFAVIFSVPFGLMGSFLFAKIFGLENNIYLQTGVIMLIGLLAKTAILITEYAIERRRKGMGIVESAYSAAQVRLRPILMTVLTMIFGMLPLMFSSGAGANGNSSLGTGVVGGMAVGTLALLFVVPVFYIIFEYLQEKIRKPMEEEADVQVMLEQERSAAERGNVE